MDKKTLTLAFGEGIGNVPSDRVCDDNQLAFEEGMIFVDGEHHVVRRPLDAYWNLDYELIFIHDYSNYTHYIQIDDGNLYVDNNPTPIGSLTGDDIKATSIGNTVIFSSTTGLTYFLWNGERYIQLGDIPELEVKTALDERTWESLDLRVEAVDMSAFLSSRTEANYEDAKSAIIGHVSSQIRKVKEKGMFPFPFWVRFGLRMYDESVTMLTAPILMLPTVRANNYIKQAADNLWIDPDTLADGFITNWTDVTYAGLFYDILSSQLIFKIQTDYSDWSDIIRGVVCYVSDDVMPFRLDGTWKFPHNLNDALGYLVYDGIGRSGVYFEKTPVSGDALCLAKPEMLSNEEIMKALLGQSQFYELCEVDMLEIQRNWHNTETDYFNTDGLMNYHALATLTSQPQLKHDDYYDHTKLTAGAMLSYNGRLQLGDITRGVFHGYSTFMFAYDDDREGIKIYVRIRTEEGEKVVMREVDSTEYLGYWFYYPDPRAFEVIYTYGNDSYSYPLKEHPFLNGAYLFNFLPSGFGHTFDNSDDVNEPTVSNNLTEMLPGYVITSEVNNPFYFPVDGWNRIGSGTVRALGATTDALSEGQFGQFPLIAFTDEGVWAMSLTKEGLYDTIHPISREVITEKGITAQTDDAIFFISERGLCVVSGKTVKLLSQAQDGKLDSLSTFGLNVSESLKKYLTLVDGMAYDYYNNLLWLWVKGKYYAWVYSLRSGAFSRESLRDPWRVSQILYPDTIIQDTSGQTYSFKDLSVLDVNSDTNNYNATILTRPIKMKDILHEKRILEILQHMLIEGNFSYTMWGSNDLANWEQVLSLGNRGWKYWRMKMTFTNIKATSVYSGVTLSYTTERPHRFREETNG